MSDTLRVPDAQIRIGDAERERTTQALVKAHSLGQLDLAEFDERCQQVMGVKTRGELREILADLPDTAEALSSSDVRPRTGPDHRKFIWIAGIVTALWLLGGVVATILAANHGAEQGGFFFPIMPLLLVAFVLTRRHHHSRR